jgi:hypothetical protein
MQESFQKLPQGDEVLFECVIVPMQFPEEIEKIREISREFNMSYVKIDEIDIL